MRRSRSRPRDRGKFPLSQAWRLALQEAAQEERPSYPPVFLLYRKYARAAIRATPARTPITMPMVAPCERPGLPAVESSVVDRKGKNK